MASTLLCALVRGSTEAARLTDHLSFGGPVSLQVFEPTLNLAYPSLLAWLEGVGVAVGCWGLSGRKEVSAHPHTENVQNSQHLWVYLGSFSSIMFFFEISCGAAWLLSLRGNNTNVSLVRVRTH